MFVRIAPSLEGSKQIPSRLEATAERVLLVNRTGRRIHAKLNLRRFLTLNTMMNFLENLRNSPHFMELLHFSQISLLNHILSQMDPVLILTPCFFKIRFNSSFPSVPKLANGLFLSGFPTIISFSFPISHMMIKLKASENRFYRDLWNSVSLWLPPDIHHLGIFASWLSAKERE